MSAIELPDVEYLALRTSSTSSGGDTTAETLNPISRRRSSIALKLSGSFIAMTRRFEPGSYSMGIT